MATRTLVKNYLAQWMQMGKGLSLSIYGEEIHIHKVVQGEKYSSAFNELWEQVSNDQSQEAYLSGTDQTISDLLSPKWDVIACARCNLLVPSLDLGARVPVCCPCDDIPNHPNLNSIAPRIPVTLVEHLDGLCDRLDQKSANQSQESIETSDTDKYPSEAEDIQTIQNLKNSMLKLIRTNHSSVCN